MSDFFTTKHVGVPDPVKPGHIAFNGNVKAVSFSTMTTFEQCPHAVYLSKIQGITGISGPAADRGSRLHELLENYVLGTVDKVNWKLFKAGNFHAPIIDTFREAHSTKPQTCVPELQLAFTKDMKKTTWESRTAWLRAMIDVAWFKSNTHAVLYDYKSGSNQAAAKHRAQLMLYALLMFIRYERLETIEVAPIYLDQRLDNFYTSYTRNDLELYWPRYLKRLQQVTECEDFQPNAGPFSCKWCQHKVVQISLNQTEPACRYAYIK